MPSWFGGREPDVSKIAKNDPVSPAVNHNPTSLVGKTGGSTPSTQPAAPTSSATNSLAYGQNKTSNPTTATSGPAKGLAAQANGYQTGPYSTASAALTTTNPSTANAGSSPSFPSPYGGTYTGIAPQAASTAVAAANNLKSSAINAGNNSIASLPSLPDAVPQQMSTGAALPALPNLPYPGMQTATATAAPNTTAGSVPAKAIQVSTVATGGTVPVSQASTPAASAYQSATTAGAYYSPGTTGRSTPYNFGSGSSPQVNIPSTNQPPLPPNTASGEALLVR